MPILNFRMQGRTQEGKPVPGQIGLQRFGPRVPVIIGVHSGLAKSLDESETPTPNPLPGQALIDTGATVTSIDAAVARQLQLAPNGNVTLGTADGPTKRPTYAFQLSVANTFSLSCPQGVECDLSGQGIIVLLGMDVLSNCILIVNGPDGSFTLSI